MYHPANLYMDIIRLKHEYYLKFPLRYLLTTTRPHIIFMDEIENHYRLIANYSGGEMMIRLSTDRISVGYGENLILNRLNVDIPDKRITTIIGPNGRGKSTLLKAVTRIIPYQSGVAILDGEEIAKMNTKSLAKSWPFCPKLRKDRAD